jgi:glycosyltransferase involved in cell wall biosynthesis
MRILVINYEYPPVGGGGGVVTRDILEYMAYKGHMVTVITSHYMGLSKQENVNGVNIIRIPVLSRKKLEIASIASMLSYCPSSVLKALVHNNANNYEILNTHFASPSGPTVYLISKLFRLPNVLTIHGGDIFDPSKSLSPHHTPFLRGVVQTMLNTADRVVAQSTDTKNNALNYYNPNCRIDIIPLGIKKPIFKKKCRQDFNIDPDVMVFCTVGRLIKRKNIDDTLHALFELRQRYRFKFIIMGEGPERFHIDKLVRQLGLGETVRLLGNVSEEEKFQILHLSDCFISTTVHEGFGLVFLEAMECGLPILCYNNGGQNDFLINGRTGFMVELGDKKELIKCLEKLINNFELVNAMRHYNMSVVKSYYIDKCAEKYLSLFEDTISNYRIPKKGFQCNGNFENKK